MTLSELILLTIAVIQVENGSLTAKPRPGDNNKSYGVMQIQQGCLTDVNRRYGTCYTLIDVHRSQTISKWVFVHYLRMYRACTMEAAAKLWNGGPGWREKPEYIQKQLDAYWNKIQEKLNENIIRKQKIRPQNGTCTNVMRYRICRNLVCKA